MKREATTRNVVIEETIKGNIAQGKGKRPNLPKKPCLITLFYFEHYVNLSIEVSLVPLKTDRSNDDFRYFAGDPLPLQAYQKLLQ